MNNCKAIACHNTTIHSCEVYCPYHEKCLSKLWRWWEKEKELTKLLPVEKQISILQKEIKVLESKTNKNHREEALLTDKKKELDELLSKKNNSSTNNAKPSDKTALIIGGGIFIVFTLLLILILARNHQKKRRLKH